MNDAPSFSFGPKILRNMRKCVNLKSKLVDFWGTLWNIFYSTLCLV